MNLVVCQKSKVDDWVSHFKENYHIVPFDLTKENRLIGFLRWNDDQPEYISIPQCVGIINYELIWRRPELLKLTDFTLMLDESSLITNPSAKRSKFILKMNPTNVILLSGTPTAGKYEKLWSQLQLLGWKISEDAFWRSYVDYEWVDRNGFYDKQVNGYKNVDHLKKRLAKFGAIFKKTEEVMDLPEQIEQMIYVGSSKQYEFFKKNHYIEIGDDELIGDTVLTKILYERQLCGAYSEEKLKAFQDLVESTEDRLVVFYNFNKELDALIQIANDCKRPFGVVNGSHKNPEVLSSESAILFVQYQAGAYGLNLQAANKIIYYTLPLGIGSCDLWEQSKKRIHRIGQNRPCFYYYLLVRNSIETWNLDLLRTGKELTDELFNQKDL